MPDPWSLDVCRAALGGSGLWPVGHDELAPFYRRAAEVVQLPADPAGWSWDWAYWRSVLPGLGFEPVLDTERVTGAMWRLSPPTRSGGVYRQELARSANVDVLLSAFRRCISAASSRTSEHFGR